MTSNDFAMLVKAPQTCARVIAQDRNSYQVISEQIEMRAELSGRFRYENTDPSIYPVVGDYVAVAIAGGTAIIDSVLPRENLFARRAINGSHAMQSIAANINTLFLVMAVNRDFNIRRLERYLVASAAYKVPCAIILSKIDLIDDSASFLAEARAVSSDTPVLAISALDQSGLEELIPFCGKHKTIAFVGSSGVGKSTLINSLLQSAQLAVTETREDDDRGRHTTTRRCLVYLKDGTAIIDTPGMREFALADAGSGVEKIFSDLGNFAAECRFRNCKHNGEPGCAVVENVDESRLQSWRKLEKEAAFEARKSNPLLAAAEKQKWKAIHKEARNRIR